MITRHITEEETPVKFGLKILLLGFLTGIGLGVGLYIVRKKIEVK